MLLGRRLALRCDPRSHKDQRWLRGRHQGQSSVQKLVSLHKLYFQFIEKKISSRNLKSEKTAPLPSSYDSLSVSILPLSQISVRFFENLPLTVQTEINFYFFHRGDHTEVIDIEYNPEVISYSQLLNLFWNNHEYGLATLIKRQVSFFFFSNSSSSSSR